MANNFKISLIAVLIILMSIFFPVFADVAPDPIVRTVTAVPYFLIAAVVVVALVLLKKLFGKK